MARHYALRDGVSYRAEPCEFVRVFLSAVCRDRPKFGHERVTHSDRPPYVGARDTTWGPETLYQTRGMSLRSSPLDYLGTPSGCEGYAVRRPEVDRSPT